MKAAKVAWVSFGVVFILLSLLYTHLAIYPFVEQKPNFKDVNQVFSQMQFPSDWQEIKSSENSGIAGRQCPIESESACFHKSKTFKVPANVTPEDVANVLKQAGCANVVINDNTYSGEVKESKVLKCSINGLDVGSDFDGPESQVYVSVRT